jgi:hypothetical protein
MKGTFCHRREELTGGRRALHSDDLPNLSSSPNIRMIKSRHIGWAWYVELIGCVIDAQRAVVEKLEGNDNFEDLDLG